jgi:thiol-disulfide isomerase/thioredoxin
MKSRGPGVNSDGVGGSGVGPQPGQRGRQGRRIGWLLAAGIAVLGSVWLARHPLNRFITQEVILANDAPDEEAVSEIIEHAADPRAALLAAWNTGKIVHREAAIRSFPQVIPAEQPLAPDFERLLLSAALDPDMNVRELALAVLQLRAHPALAALAAEQLKDCDPQVRLLGLDHLRSVSAAVGVPIVIPALEDPDSLIVAMGVKLLEIWSNQKFGVKLSETVPVENETTGQQEYRQGSLEKAKAGAERAKAWWGEYRSEFPPVSLEVPAIAYSSRQAVPAPDFQLRTLGGQRVRLSDLRGKVVLVNFWTTWCAACVSEMPELIALQAEHKDNLVILGVSLDYVPDEQGHLGGHAAVEEQARAEDHHNDHELRAAALKRVREKVARTVAARGISYAILLDERNQAGGRYNGGELPTTVIVDRQGNIRRRFIGARSLAVFKAIVAEAERPPGLPPTVSAR